MARPKKIDPQEVIDMWKACTHVQPHYTKAGLSRLLGIHRDSVRRILREAVDRGDLPPNTFGKFGEARRRS